MACDDKYSNFCFACRHLCGNVIMFVHLHVNKCELTSALSSNNPVVVYYTCAAHIAEGLYYHWCGSVGPSLCLSWFDLVTTIETNSLCVSSSNLADMLTMVRGWILFILEVRDQGHSWHMELNFEHDRDWTVVCVFLKLWRHVNHG